MKKSKGQIVGVLLIILHVVGIVGFSIDETRQLFQWLTPLNLILSLGFLLWLHPNRNTKFILLSVTVGTLGYLLEVAGVNTGLIFGSYTYGATLGLKVWSTPLLIGANWLMMIYYTGAIAKRVVENRIFQVLIGTGLMVIIDLLIEPVAIRYDYWSWTSVEIPLQNYVGWFAVALTLHILYNGIEEIRKNPVAMYLAAAQFIFFLGLNIIRTI